MNENVGRQQSQLGNMGVSREKIWPERSAEEKLEALRAEILQLMHLTLSQNRQIALLSRHLHSETGDIVVRIDDGRHEADGPTRRYIPTALRDKE